MLLLLLQLPPTVPSSEFSMLEGVEYAVIALVIGFQVYFFWRTLNTMRAFRSSMPEASACRLQQVTVLRDDLGTVSPTDLLNKLSDFVNAAADHREQQLHALIDLYRQQGLTINEAITSAERDVKASNKFETINLLTINDVEESEIMARISHAINTYLIRNKGAIADFNLLRDIVQRNLDTLEEEIAITVPIPVYLGLMGTMAGIIIGLFSLPNVGSDAFTEGAGITNLLGGVKIAMIASLMGLLLTVSLNGFVFKGAKNLVERRKNDFYTFLQTELLPVLSESVSAGIVGLNRSLDRFSELFGMNVEKLEGLMAKNYDALMAQQQAVSALERIDLSRVAKLNVTVLGELKQSMDALERLAYGLKQVDSFVANARDLVIRSQDFVGLAEKIGSVLTETQELQRFLVGHFSQLEERGQLINDTVVRLDEVVAKSLTDLEKHIYERIQAVKQIQVQEEDLLKKEFSQNRGVLSKLNFLESLTETLSQYAKSDATLQGSLLGTMHQLKEETATTNRLLTHSIRQAERSMFTRLFSRSNGAEH